MEEAPCRQGEGCSQFFLQHDWLPYQTVFGLVQELEESIWFYTCLPHPTLVVNFWKHCRYIPRSVCYMLPNPVTLIMKINHQGGSEGE